MDMYVVCESRSGKVSQAAEAIAEAAASHGVATLLCSIDDAIPDHLVAADVVVAGCRIQGETPFGGDAAQRMATWIGSLPTLEGQPVGVFCTFGFFPHSFADVTARTSEVLRKMTEGFILKGGEVVASHPIYHGEIDKGAVSFVSQVLEQIDG